jgi:cadmium resistance protein CadD (predicted permease)
VSEGVREKPIAGPKRAGWVAKRLHNPTIARSATVGILTHAPGPSYLAALGAIIQTKPHFVNGVIQVLVYNLIWFALPIAAFILSIKDAEEARARIESVGAWTRRHERIIGPLLLTAVGVYLVVTALVKLL